MNGVFEFLRIAAVNISDPFAVGTPGGRTVPIRVGIVPNERDTFGIRRPGEVFHAAVSIRDLLPLAAADGQHPELIVLVVVFAPGKEGDPFSIRAPARMFLALVSKGQGTVFRAVP